MSNTPNPQITTITLPVSQNQSVDFAKLFKKYLFHWPLFFSVLLVCFVGAYFYIKYAKPAYPIKATLEFKDDKNENYSNKTGLKELDQISDPVIVENEIEVMKSKKLMFQVVTQLQLWTSYTKKDGLKSKDLYKTTPAEFAFVKQNGSLSGPGEKLQVEIKDNQHYLLIGEDGKKNMFRFGQVIKSEFGTWKLNATQNVGNFFGSTILIGIRDPDLVSDSYQTALKVALENKDAPFVNLNISDEVPARGRDILNSLMALYNASAINDKNRKAQATISFIDKRLDSISKDLYNSEQLVARFNSTQGITDTKSQANELVMRQQASAKELADLDGQINVVDGIEAYINSPKNSNRAPSTGGLTDGTLNSMLDKLSDLLLKKDQMMSTTPEQNPIFIPVNKQIATLQDGIKDRVRTIRSSLIATKNRLSSYNSNIDTKIRDIPNQDRQSKSLSRTSDIKSALYTYLLQKREEISLRYASSVSDAQIVDDAHAGPMQWPKPMIIYVMACVIGLGIPAGIIYGRDSFDVQITNRKQIEDAIAIPILGELSFQESSTPIVISQGRGKFAIGEQFRVLRTNLYHVHNNNDSGRVTIFTSSTGGEGKSFVSANLAVTLAYASRKTVILEMDLRKPKISLTFGLPMERTGISNYLDGEPLKIEDLIQPSGIPGLDVMGCGSILPNPSELLEKTKLDELILALRKIYDDVIIDTPPIHLVTDALIISRVADASLYIMRQGYTQKAELDFIKEINLEKRLPKLNIIFNGIKRDKYGYGYNYDNSYYNTYVDRHKNTFGNMVRKFFTRF